MTIRIGLVGFGKIARDEHLPAILADPRYRLVAVATRSEDPGIGVPCFGDFSEMIAALPGELDAVALCTPPDVRTALARTAIVAGIAALLEKPPATTLGEVAEIERLARETGTPVYAAWHSQHAAGVADAVKALAGQDIASLQIVWREDVRRWHPGQQWIWQAGGFGVFDTGINALSIASRILPGSLLVREARLMVPANRQAPIAADMVFSEESLRAEFDWRPHKEEERTITVQTAAGRIVELSEGGHRLTIDGVEQPRLRAQEYPSIYDRFSEVVREQQIDVDAEPLRICADAFLCGSREAVEAFIE